MIGPFKIIVAAKRMEIADKFHICENPANYLFKLPGGRFTAKLISLFFLLLRSYLNAFLTAFLSGGVVKRGNGCSHKRLIISQS
jgi:hypothetical protein